MICPECKKEINHVDAYSEGFQKVTIDEDGYTLNWSSPEMLGDVTFYCPHCEEGITDFIKPT